MEPPLAVSFVPTPGMGLHVPKILAMCEENMTVRTLFTALRELHARTVVAPKLSDSKSRAEYADSGTLKADGTVRGKVTGMVSQRLKRTFLNFAGAVFLVTGVAKIWLLFDPSRALDTSDPVFGYSFRFLAAGVGIVEVITSGFCFFDRRPMFGVGLVAWLTSNILLYRMLLVLFDWKLPCQCLGSLTGRLPFSPRTANTITGCLLISLVVGSYALLCWLGTSQKERASPQSSEAVKD